MTRLGLAFGILAAVGGCGRLGGVTGVRTPSIPGVPGSDPAAGARPVAAGELTLEEVDAAPDCVRVAEAPLGFSRMSSGRGYFWVGYAAADVGQEDLNKVGRGDGFTFGGGFRLTDSSHTYIEVAYERTLKHEMDPNIVWDPVNADSVAPPVREQGFHERSLVGFRTAAAPRARMQSQPRPYISYGIGYNLVKVRYYNGTETVGLFMNGVGYYVGFGCEFPFEGRSSFSFDAKFHTWVDADPPDLGTQPLFGDEATFGSLAFAMLWMNRF